MIDRQSLLLSPVKHLIDAVKIIDQAGDPTQVGVVADIDMRYLMVGDRESARLPRVQVFPALLGVHR